MLAPRDCAETRCNGSTYLSDYCGAWVCDTCDQHTGLARCFCGWSESGSDGRAELIAMGETIEEGV